MRCRIPGRRPPGFGHISRSDHPRQLVEGRSKGPAGQRTDPEFVVTPADAFCRNAWPRTMTQVVRSPFNPAHRAQPRLEPPVVGFDSVVRVLGGVVKRERKGLGDAALVKGGDRSVVTSLGVPWTSAKKGLDAFEFHFVDANTSMTWPCHPLPRIRSARIGTP